MLTPVSSQKIKQHFRFHVVALPVNPILQIEGSRPCCTMTRAIRGFIQMMMSLGHQCFLYGPEDSDVTCSERIPVLTRKEIDEYVGKGDGETEITRLRFAADDDLWRRLNERSIEAIKTRIMPGDFICLQGGAANSPIAYAFPNNLAVEYLIGYDGSFAPARVFQTYSHMHYSFGRQGLVGGSTYNALHDVIGFYYDPADYPVQTKKDNYFLFMGRMIAVKGPHLAAQVCRDLGVKLLLAGPSGKQTGPGAIQGVDILINECPNAEYLGVLGGKERAEVMGKAKGLFCATQYMEPFASVSMEATMTGCPIISSDFGCFTETVINGVNGYRARTFKEFVQAADAATKLDPLTIAARARGLYDEALVRWRYQSYFERIASIYAGGWYA